uniref:Uncharacterized protein n=1 Tax=Anguilla anguilla TaxID=7936 RepID=A0A0E9V645_ANGAN
MDNQMHYKNLDRKHVILINWSTLNAAGMHFHLKLLMAIPFYFTHILHFASW